ncbi:protein phosphatase 2C, putative [Trypanosoma equiperdum]|uniref:Protein phosphatase n=4 Tax=Trypanozoon TaxID=39700 RepID=Q585I2_TRYB2|nr:protein phosphatase 2C, putative [Trypanosoma brucei gambiense DAL972]XP_844518.1 protein phosphatase 2C, putative [Trypanosoma brucei brucei TREU927]AAX79223.1 protein phosphatase 2C, putative [Trypanosoma brucei]RHW73023.1 protein phosphatase 2C [Trypanosoma brucei equiperdum]SCU72307.1 protein phosphatase 2C, putative [Trypanosoma equiperdum]AAZ10959.1 protein phosphatase 2C, putative [Trypanosoma brucei brucei TREU927]CBH10664.1 protein phosphatase 2C, putative [Trypanosoma brucei gamb|eukprot:XP_011772952.1 protein phosphatase 2C, putative [Trypanosoma brucei gambiense DAL972]
MFTPSTRFLCSARPLLWFGRRGVFAAPHPEKAKTGGEDAFVVHTSGIGVADGVGGYASYGVDPGVYTRNVMKHTLRALQEDDNRGTIGALQALTYGYTEAQKLKQPGGCPVTLVTLLDGRFASVLNLGDCGTICLRSSKLFFATEPQQHSFNCPYQLPEDPPSVGDRTTLEVSEGDVFLCASDGLLDNVDMSDILRHLDAVNRDGCQRVAENLVACACRNGANKGFDSPFAKQARAVGYHYMGGKQDDVTVVVAQLTRGTVAPDDCPSLITELLDVHKT